MPFLLLKNNAGFEHTMSPRKTIAALFMATLKLAKRNNFDPLVVARFR